MTITHRKAASADIVVRTAARGDAAAIHDLLADLAATIGQTTQFKAGVEDLVRAGFGEDPAFHVLLAERCGKPLGLALFFHTYSSWRGSRGVYVQDLHVVASERGSGLGRRLLAAAAEQGRAAGCTHLRLSVARGNDGARGFYRRLGLAECHGEVVCEIADGGFTALAAEVCP